jgi:hypothetical protein
LSSWFLSATEASCDFAAQGNPTLQTGPPTLSNPTTDGSLSIMLPKFNMESKACTNHSRSALQQGLKRMALELLYIYINMDRYKLNIIQLDIKRDIEDSITTHM